MNATNQDLWPQRCLEQGNSSLPAIIDRWEPQSCPAEWIVFTLNRYFLPVNMSTRRVAVLNLHLTIIFVKCVCTVSRTCARQRKPKSPQNDQGTAVKQDSNVPGTKKHSKNEPCYIKWYQVTIIKQNKTENECWKATQYTYLVFVLFTWCTAVHTYSYSRMTQEVRHNARRSNQCKSTWYEGHAERNTERRKEKKKQK